MNRWNIWLWAALVMALAACGNSREDQLVTLLKCAKAGEVLEDARLHGAGLLAAAKIGPGPKNRAMEAMELGQIVRDELEPQGTGTRVERVLTTAQKWRDSETCQQVVADFDKAVKADVDAHLRSFAETGAALSCSDFSKQYELTFVNIHARPYREQLIPYLRETLRGSTGQLKTFQSAAVSAQLDDAHIRRFGGEVRSLCKEFASLQASIGRAEVVRQAQSDVTQELDNDLQRVTALGAGLPRSIEFRASLVGDRDAPKPHAQCGDFYEIFCLQRVQVAALRQSLEQSIACDRDEPSAEACQLDASGRFDRNTVKLQLQAFRAAQASLVTYLEDPRRYNANADAHIERMSEDCKRLAIRQGLRDTAYSDYVKSNCAPQARRRFEEPQRELLGRVDAEIARLGQTGAVPQKAGVAGDESCVNQWITAFRKENGQDAPVRHDQLQEWEDWCAAGRKPEKARS